jgi:hypothetical protein
MVEEADVVVALLERHELALDECVHLGEERGDVGRDVEVHPVAIPRSRPRVKIGRTRRVGTTTRTASSADSPLASPPTSPGGRAA